MRRRILLAVTRTLAAYGFVAWMYVAIISIVQHGDRGAAGERRAGADFAPRPPEMPADAGGSVCRPAGPGA